MKRSRRQGSPRILKTDLPSLLLSWLKGVWGSLRRFVMRLLRPNRGRRDYTIELKPEKPHTCPLVGVEGLKQAGALTVSELMEKVQWHLPEETPEEALETFLDAIAAVPKVHSLQLTKPHIAPLVGVEGFRQAAESLTVGDLIRKVRWHDDRICPLAGIGEIGYAESLSVGNLMESVLWRVPGKAVDDRTRKVRLRPAEEPPQTSLDPIPPVVRVRSGLQLAKPHISPLVGIEGFGQAAESLTVGDLIRKVCWHDHLICPLVGVEQIGYAESRSVSKLMESVLWQFPGETTENFADLSADSIAPVQETLANNAHTRPLICPLVGVEQLRLTESLTVGNLMTSVQWRVIKKASKASPKTSSPSNVTSIPDEINWD